jgi:hypothetical protein
LDFCVEVTCINRCPLICCTAVNLVM